MAGATIRLSLALLVLWISMLAVSARRRPAPKQSVYTGYYQNTCPDVERIIHNRVKYWITKDKTVGPALIRLHFHDCIVRGCDASVLLDHPGSERDAYASRTLRGFEVINDIKAHLEKECPKTVSCADILFTAARDATKLIGGPFWPAPMGRKDGYVSVAKEAEKVPEGKETLTELIELFQMNGLSIIDLVALSGAHTIGRSSCNALENRLYNYNNTKMPDKSMDPGFLSSIRGTCKYGWRWGNSMVYFDVTTPTKFDNAYYKNLYRKKGLLATDQMLHDDPRTDDIVQIFARDHFVFDQQFSVSMVNLGMVKLLTGEEGQVRKNCNFINRS